MSSQISGKTLKELEAARYISMSASWLRQSRMTGNPESPPYVKIGRAVRYLREDLDAWLERSRRCAATISPESTRSRHRRNL